MSGAGEDGDGGREGNRQERHDRQDRGNRQDEEPSAAAKALTGISVLLTVLLFGYVAWQAVQPPVDAHPQATVVGTDEASNGSVLVRVELTNPGDTGLISATVETDCEQPPPDVTFDYVPAGGREQGVLVCPTGTTDPNVSVSSWVPT
jgi:uncharacterized protein (TIGR02588 family)